MKEPSVLPAATLTELEAQIQVRYSSLSNRLQQVSQYLLDNHNNIAFDTVAIISENAGVPPSTLIRFANAFGFSGFNDMKQLFRQHLVEETSNYADRTRLFKELETDRLPLNKPEDILREFANANSESMQQLATSIQPQKLEDAVDIMLNAKNIYIIGLRRSFTIATYLAYSLRHLNRRVFLIDGLGGMLEEQMSMVDIHDAVISISFAPYAQETKQLTELASKASAKQITITDSPFSPTAILGDVCFVIKEAKVDAFRSQSSSLCLAQSLTVALAFKQNYIADNK